MKTLKDLMNMQGRVTHVTGGGRDIGKSLCETVAELGAAIVVLDREKEICIATAKQIKEDYNVGTMPLVVDLQDDEAIAEVPARVLDRFGRLDVLVNNAAYTFKAGSVDSSDIKDQQIEAWKTAVDINLTAPFILTQACSEALSSSGHGAVINVASIYGLVAPQLGLYEGVDMGNPAAYAASKAVPTERIAAIGDEINDLSMISNAGLGIAMANAATRVREAADQITESNNEDGVAHAIERMLDGVW